MKARPTRRFTCVSLVLLLSLGTLLAPSPAAAATPVHDYVNWILSLYQRYQQISNQYEQISNQVRELQYLAKALESFGDGSWNYFDFAALRNLLGYGEHLGYLNDSLEDLFDSTFPGYTRAQSWPDEVETRVARTRRTLRQINQALRTLAEDNEEHAIQLRFLQVRSDAADSPVEELETANMFASMQVADTQRQIQATLLVANTLAVAHAEQLQIRASIEASRNHWLSQESLPDPDDAGSYTGIPRDWTTSLSRRGWAQ